MAETSCSLSLVRKHPSLSLDVCRIIGELRVISKTAGADFRPTINRVSPRVLRDAELRRIYTPVLLLVGDHEGIYRPEDAFRRASRLVRNLKIEIVPNPNHSAQYTAPDYVNRRILEFLLP